MCWFRFESLKSPMANRRKKLEDSLKLHQFNFDADSEMQWIKEHTPAATSTDYGKNLIDAQNRHKKHKVSSSCEGIPPVSRRIRTWSWSQCSDSITATIRPHEKVPILMATKAHISVLRATILGSGDEIKGGGFVQWQRQQG